MLDTESAKTVGISDTSGWPQAYEFRPGNPEETKKRGSLFVVSDSKTLELRLTTRLREEYFGDLLQKPFNALKTAVEKTVLESKELGESLEIAVCSFVGGVVYSVASGGAKVFIYRSGSLAKILESEGMHVVEASGYPERGDVALLVTRGFYGKIPQDIMVSSLNGTLKEAVDSFNSRGGVGAVLIKFNERSFVVNPPVFKKGFKEKISKFIRTINDKIPKNNIYIKPDVVNDFTTQNKKLTFSVAVVLLVVLTVSIVFGIRQKKVNDLKRKYAPILSAAKKEVDDAINLSSVSPDKSRELFVDSEAKLKEIDALKIKEPEIEDLRRKISDSRSAILGEYAVTPELFLDLSLLSSGFKGDVLSSSGGNVFILDKGGKRIIGVAIDNKKSKVVAGPSVIDEVRDLASYEDRVFILSPDGIYEVGNTKTKVVEKIWSEDVLIRVFAGNMYVLNKTGNMIYRYAGSGNAFGDKQDWLSASARVDFSDAVQWGIDGSVYVLFPNSKIQKFSLGSPHNFNLSGIIPEIGKIDAIYADADNQYVYLLDRAGKRVVVTNKNGKYKAQYIGDQIGDVVSLVVSESEKKIIFLTGERLMSIDTRSI